MAESVFGAWDYAIIAATMIVPVAMGIYFRFSGGKQKTNEEYLLADRNMSILPVAVSLVASFMSAITLLGVSAENHYYGMIFILVNVSNGLGTPIATKFYLPVFFCLQKTSTYEYLELRFGPNIRTLASLTYTVQMILYNGIVLYAPAIVLESVTGFDRFVSILVVGLACTFYSTLGGMKAVLFTDLLQSLLMFGAVLSIVVFCSIQLGGFGEIFRIAYEGGRINFNNFSPDPTQRHTWWSLLCGGIITYLSLYGVNHTQIDQLMPYYVVDVMNSVPGLAGLFVAGIFSASLSTISAACNSLAAVTLSDYVGRWCKIRESHIPWLTKLAACAYGLVFLALAFLAEHMGGVLQAALTIFGAVGGPLLGVFTLGMFTTYANERGVSVGLLSGLALTFWISFGTPRPAPAKLPLSVAGCSSNVTLPDLTAVDPTDYFYLYRISYQWTSPIGFVWVLVVGSAVSAWRHAQPWERAGAARPDPALFTPPLATWLRGTDEKPAPQKGDS